MIELFGLVWRRERLTMQRKEQLSSLNFAIKYMLKLCAHQPVGNDLLGQFYVQDGMESAW